MRMNLHVQEKKFRYFVILRLASSSRAISVMAIFHRFPDLFLNFLFFLFGFGIFFLEHSLTRTFRKGFGCVGVVCFSFLFLLFFPPSKKNIKKKKKKTRKKRKREYSTEVGG